MLDVSTHSMAVMPPEHPPVLLIVVDTEEEFDWSKPFSRANVGVSSISAQTALHDEIYDGFGVVPTYAIDWPVASTASSIDILNSLRKAGRCEIGTHLHPWVNPPLKEQVNTYNSFPGNLPEHLERDKIIQLTNRIELNFGIRPSLYKAGRYGVSSFTTSVLVELGYTMDASVVPNTSFSGIHGPDFTDLPEQPYWFGPKYHRLLELPVTTGFTGSYCRSGATIYPYLCSKTGLRLRLPGVVSRLGLLERIRLTPEGHTQDELYRLIKTLIGSGQRVLTLTYHSSTLVPGNTAYVKSAQDLVLFKKIIKNILEIFHCEFGGTFISAPALRDLLLNQLLLTAS